MTVREYRRYGELVMETVASRAFAFIGDANDAMGILRRAVGQLVRNGPPAHREAVAKALNLSVRTLDGWLRAARDYERSAVNDEQSLLTSTLAGRIFFTTITYLQGGGAEYRSLGRIADHLKESLRFSLSTDQVKQHLNAYVALGFLEQHPGDDELYRIVARSALWKGPAVSQEHVEKLLGYLLPEAFMTGFKVFTGDPSSMARLILYEVPEPGKAEFIEKFKEKMRRLKDEMDELEEAMRERYPDAPRTFVREVLLAGEGPRDWLVEGFETLVEQTARNNSEPGRESTDVP